MNVVVLLVSDSVYGVWEVLNTFPPGLSFKRGWAPARDVS